MTTTEAKWATDERRLGPAYDDLAAGRLKSASSIVERHLKKHPTSQPALVLRMAILERLESTESDILQSWEAVKKTGRLTGRSAWFIGTTFRNIGRRDLTLQIYQEQWANQPDNAELGEQVFVHAAPAWDKEAMVESSRKMFNKLKAPVWARVAAWSEWVKHVPHPPSQDSFTSSNSNDLRVSSTLLSLARKNCESADILWLHLQILISAGNLSDALTLAQSAGAEGSLARLWYRMEGVKEILSRMKEKGEDTTAGWTAELEWVKGRLQSPECQRNYAYYRHYLLATEHLKTNESVVSDTLVALEALHSEIGEKERAPRLAILELDNLLVKDRHAKALSPEQWTDLIGAYWTKWGSKGSIISELEGAVGDHASKRDALGQILDETDSSHTTLEEYRGVVNKEMLLLRGRPESWTADEHYLRSLSKLYSGGLQYGRNLPKTDVQPADDIGLALTQVLVVQWSRSGNETPLLRAILLLRYILDHSPACKSALLLLGRLLRLVGASSISECTVATAAKEWSEVQLDNLSHFSHDRAGIESYVNDTAEGWEKYEAKATRMYKRTAGDMPDYIKQALQNESYSKIPGIRTLAYTLQNSASRYLMAVEQARLHLALGEPTPAPARLTLQEALRNGDVVTTADWSLLPDLGPARGSLREAVILGDEPSSDWIQTWASVVLRVEGVEETPNIILDSSLLPIEQAMISLVLPWISRTQDALQSRDNVAKNTGNVDLSGFIDGVISGLQGASSPWLRLYRLFLVIEIKCLLTRLHSRLNAASKPSGKKSKPPPTVVDMVKELGTFQQSLQAEVERLLPLLDDLKEGAEKVDWEAVYQLDDLPEGASLVEFGKTVTSARIKAIDSIRKHLTA